MRLGVAHDIEIDKFLELQRRRGDVLEHVHE